MAQIDLRYYLLRDKLYLIYGISKSVGRSKRCYVKVTNHHHSIVHMFFSFKDRHKCITKSAIIGFMK
jgi:hypothetical protein